MSEICTICAGVSCENPPELAAYSLQNNSLYNAQYIFLVQCPTGYFCPAGLFPKYVTIKKNRKSIPFPPPGATSISVQGCQSLIVIPIPSGSDTAAINALQQAALLQWAAQQAICDSITENKLQPKTSFVFNDLVSTTCSGGLLFRISYPYTLPPPVFAQGGKLWMKAGTTSASTKEEANAQAIAFLQGEIAAKISDGVIECGYWNALVEYNCGLSIQIIPAFTFFSTISQADANAKALVAAQLQCNPMAICNWSDILSVLPGGCAASTFPAWDGVFDLVNFDSVTFGDTIYYFKSKSINAGQVAVDESADVNYPNGNWQDTGQFTAIYGIPGNYWQLNIWCVNGTFLWRGDWVANERTPGDGGPAGYYQAQMGYTPDIICVQPVGVANCNCCHITPDPLPDADEGVAYSEQLQLDGKTQGTWAVTGGALPNGIALSSAGLLAGTPTASGTFNFEVTVEGCVKNMSLNVTGSTCPNWDDLLWGTATLSAGDTFTPQNTTSASFTGSATNALGIWKQTATLDYNSSGCNCNLEVTLTNIWGTDSLGCFEVEIVGGPILIYIQRPANSQPAGTYDFPFSLPDTAGLTKTIKFTFWGSSLKFDSTLPITASGTFSNV